MSPRGLRWPLGLAALVLAAGCTTVGPDFARPTAPLPAQWQQSTQTPPSLASAPAQRLAWWEVFGDPVLDRLIEVARQQNYGLTIAGLRVIEARARLGQAIGTLYPQAQMLRGSATYNAISKQDVDSPGSNRFWLTTLGAEVGWELDFWGRYRRAVEAADADVMATISGYDNALVLVTAQVAGTYVVIRTAEEQLRVARENVARQQHSVRITEARFRGGDVDELDVLQARTQLLDTQATIPEIELGLEQARGALAVLLGRLPDGIDELLGTKPGAIPRAPVQIAAGVPADLLRRRPDIREAEFLAATQNAAVGVAEGELYPKFGLRGFFGALAVDQTATTRTGGILGPAQLINSSSLFFLGGPYFEWNILNYGSIRNNVRVQDARLQQLLVNYQDTVLKAVREVEDGMVGMLRSREQEQILLAAEASARRSLAVATVQYQEGYVSFQRVLDAQAVLLSAQRRSVAARSATAGAAVAVYRALGGGWEIRPRDGFVDAATKETMRNRTHWGDLLQPQATEPPLKGEDGRWPSPDW